MFDLPRFIWELELDPTMQRTCCGSSTRKYSAHETHISYFVLVCPSYFDSPHPLLWTKIKVFIDLVSRPQK